MTGFQPAFSVWLAICRVLAGGLQGPAQGMRHRYRTLGSWNCFIVARTMCTVGFSTFWVYSFCLLAEQCFNSMFRSAALALELWFPLLLQDENNLPTGTCRFTMLTLKDPVRLCCPTFDNLRRTRHPYSRPAFSD